MTILSLFRRTVLRSLRCRFGTVSVTGSEPHVLRPPEIVRGLKILDEKAIKKFEKKVRIPVLHICSEQELLLFDILKFYRLKLNRLKAVQDLDPGKKLILLNPDLVTNFNSFGTREREILDKIGISESEGFDWKELTLGYENWSIERVFAAVLPEGETVRGYAKVGHILHVNLEAELVPYKQLIGKVLLDKVSDVRTVVNKERTISNSFRTFKIEVLAGENNMETHVREENCSFYFDFSKVYWNSRLSYERKRIINKMTHNSVVYDVFAGVGPFSILAGKKLNCTVLANDLNPDAYGWLRRNIKANKVGDYVTAYNLDGREFLKSVVRDDLVAQWREATERKCTIPVHVFMNLPGIAVEFLDAFLGMFSGYSSAMPDSNSLPTVHCYTFSKDPDRESVIGRIEERLEGRIDPGGVEVHHVRDVAPNKVMMCASFKLCHRVLFVDGKKSNGAINGRICE